MPLRPPFANSAEWEWESGESMDEERLHSTPRCNTTCNLHTQIDSPRLSTSTLDARFATCTLDLQLAPQIDSPRLATRLTTRPDSPPRLDWRLTTRLTRLNLHTRRAISFFGHHPLRTTLLAGGIDALWPGGTDSGSHMAWAALPAFLLAVDLVVLIPCVFDVDDIRTTTTVLAAYTALRRRYPMHGYHTPPPPGWARVWARGCRFPARRDTVNTGAVKVDKDAGAEAGTGKVDRDKEGKDKGRDRDRGRTS
ncbi:hypothetical protein B0H13DRAFT_2464716 [Mycena leptocephala]|nr:hypothetical protein B0H13DRAFT_2464716 [Mycena leptocephala]